MRILHTAVVVVVMVVEAEAYQVPVAEEEYDTNYIHNSAAAVEHVAAAAGATSWTTPVQVLGRVH